MSFLFVLKGDITVKRPSGLLYLFYYFPRLFLSLACMETVDYLAKLDHHREIKLAYYLLPHLVL